MKAPQVLRRLAAVALLGSTFAFSVADRANAATAECQETGENCAVGMRGPQGGVIFYDAGSQQWWGRYLEAQLLTVAAQVPWGAPLSIYPEDSRAAMQRRSMAIGMGRENTRLMREAQSPLALTHFSADQDWYLPSKDELDALYNYRVLNLAQPATMWTSLPMWSSSESEAGFAWYQLFQDGTQFTDAQGIIPGLKANKNYIKSPVHVGSNFTSLPMNVVKVRSFPTPGSPPVFPMVTSVRNNEDCTKRAVNCVVGDRGPAGGIIVYDAGSDKSWGRYLEIAPQECEISRVAFNSTASKPAIYGTQADRVRAKAIGMGRANTDKVSALFAGAARSTTESTCGSYTDWFLPSKDELNEAFRWLSHSRTGLQLTPVGGFQRGYYWTSTDYNGSTAWTQYFADGQQFDRVQTLAANKQPPSRPLYVRPMRAFASGSSAQPSRPPIIPVVEKSISIVGERTTVSGKSGVRVDGTVKGFKDGDTVVPFVRFPGQTSYTEGSSRPEIQGGSFTWQRKTGKKTYVYFATPDGQVLSNRVIIPAG